MTEQKGEMKKVVGRILSYAVYVNGQSIAGTKIFNGSLAITSEVPADENVDPHSLYEYIRKTAIEAAKDATLGEWDRTEDSHFSVVITHHFYP